MDVIQTLYQSLGYIEVHGTDIMITTVLILATFFITGYTSYQGLLAKLRSDWENQRCVPIVLPFAGYIMPVSGKTSSEVNVENVNYCIKKDVSEAFSTALMPLEFALYIAVEFLDSIEVGIRFVMKNIKDVLKRITDEKNKIYNRVAYVVVPVVEMLLYVRDALAKTNGVMTVALYTVMNIYNIIVSGSINLMKVLKNTIIQGTNTSTGTGYSGGQNIFLGNYRTDSSFASIAGCAFATIGDGLTDYEAKALYWIVQKYQTTLGRQVY